MANSLELAQMSEYIWLCFEMTERQATEVQRGPSHWQFLRRLIFYKMKEFQDKAYSFVEFYECVHLTSECFSTNKT